MMLQELALLVEQQRLIGQDLVEKSAGTAEVAYNLSGTLYLSSSGWLLLSVPNGIGLSVFKAMNEPGIELPPSPNNGPYNAHISVMSAKEVEALGGGQKINERGKQFSYTLGRLMSVDLPDGQPELAKVWFIKVHSPDLQALRRSYGLSSLPHNGDYDFHVSCAVRRKGVLGRNEIKKQ